MSIINFIDSIKCIFFWNPIIEYCMCCLTPAHAIFRKSEHLFINRLKEGEIMNLIIRFVNHISVYIVGLFNKSAFEMKPASELMQSEIIVPSLLWATRTDNVEYVH